MVLTGELLDAFVRVISQGRPQTFDIYVLEERDVSTSFPRSCYRRNQSHYTTPQFPKGARKGPAFSLKSCLSAHASTCSVVWRSMALTATKGHTLHIN